MKTVDLLAGGTLLLLGSGVAFAAPGDHLGNESTQIIPSIELGLAHRTNVFLIEGEAGGGSPVVGGTALLITPAATLRHKRGGLEANVDFSYEAKKYFQARATNLDRFKTFNLGGNLRYLPDGAKVGFRLGDRFSITGYEAEDENGVARTAYQEHILNDLGAFVMVQPGGPLEVDAGFKLAADRWNVPEEFKSAPDERESDLDLLSGTTGPGLNSRLGYGPALEGRWRFFPKTAIVLDFNHEWFSWKDNVVDAQGDGISREDVGDLLAIPDGRIWRVKSGLRGRITSKLVAGLVVGYGQAIYDEDSVTEAGAALGLEGSSELDPEAQGFGVDRKAFGEGLLAEVDAELSPSESQKLQVGYRRDFQDVYFTNYVNYDRVNLGYDVLLADKVGLTPSFLYRFERYKGEVARNDHFIKLGLDGRYLATKYLDIRAAVNWTRRASADQLHPEIEYDDARFQLGARFTY